MLSKKKDPCIWRYKNGMNKTKYAIHWAFKSTANCLSKYWISEKALCCAIVFYTLPKQCMFVPFPHHIISLFVYISLLMDFFSVFSCCCCCRHRHWCYFLYLSILLSLSFSVSLRMTTMKLNFITLGIPTANSFHWKFLFIPLKII